MACYRKFDFKTEAEANAFVQGVEFVNDSSIIVGGIMKTGSDTFIVHITDQDACDEDL